MNINLIILILIIFIYNVTGLYYIFPVIVSIINIFLTSIKLVANPEDIWLRIINFSSLLIIIMILVINLKILYFSML